MIQDALLAIFHHLAVFTLLALLVAECALIIAPLTASKVHLLGRLDLAYGLSAVLVLLAGFLRVFYGAKGSAFYLHNPLFILKIALFAGIAVISIVPTLRFLQWRQRLRKEPGWLPMEMEVQRAAGWIKIELLVFAGIPVLAALMARGIGYTS